MLEADGYALVQPARRLNDRQRAAALRFGVEFLLVKRAGNLQVELRWRMMENALLLAGADPWSHTRDVALSETITLRSMDDELLFAYLCAHGAGHGWYRLKWLADLNALLSENATPNSNVSIVLPKPKAAAYAPGRRSCFVNGFCRGNCRPSWPTNCKTSFSPTAGAYGVGVDDRPRLRNRVGAPPVRVAACQPHAVLAGTDLALFCHAVPRVFRAARRCYPISATGVAAISLSYLASAALAVAAG